MNPTTDLTRDRIMELKAGRDLDFLIEIHVFGSTGVEIHACGNLVHGNAKIPPAYSSSIQDAFKVVEKMREFRPTDVRCDLGPWFSLDAPLDAEAKWTAGWRSWVQYEGEGMCANWHATGETAPLAICRAALLKALS